MPVGRGGRLKVDQRSLRRVLARIEAKGEEMRRQAAAFLFERAEAVMEEAKNETPVDIGTLESSGFVEPPDVSRGKISVALGFGGAAKAYAIPVHEDMKARHTVGKAKFLEDPIRRTLPTLAKDLAAAIKV